MLAATQNSHVAVCASAARLSPGGAVPESPGFTANQMFLAVDRLSRERRVLLRYQNAQNMVLSGQKSRVMVP